MGKLTARDVRDIQKPGRYGDGNGLYLVVAPTGTKNWVQRVRLPDGDGKRTDRGLGGVGSVTLAGARKAATANLASLQAKVNPFQKATAPKPKATPQTLTLREAAYQVHESKRAKWEGDTATKWLSRVETHVCQTLGTSRVDKVTRSELAELLTDLRQAGHHETARKVRGALTLIFQWVRAHDYRTDNPADDALMVLVDDVKQDVAHRKALPHADVAGALRKVRFGYAMRETQDAFEFLVLTAARSGDVRHMTWEEVDLGARVWTIPAERMKARREHQVPLSEQALAILRRHRFAPDRDADPDSMFTLKEIKTGYVFRRPQNGGPLSENAFSDRAKKDSLGCVPHGFRTSWRVWAREVYKGEWEAIEMSLAHSVGTSVTQAYFRTHLLGERAPMMQAWADYVLPSESPF